MKTAAKLVYGSTAVVSTVTAVFFAYAASLGVDGWFWLGVGEYVWLTALWGGLSLVWWFVLLRRPGFMYGTERADR